VVYALDEMAIPYLSWLDNLAMASVPLLFLGGGLGLAAYSAHIVGSKAGFFFAGLTGGSLVFFAWLGRAWLGLDGDDFHQIRASERALTLETAWGHEVVRLQAAGARLVGTCAESETTDHEGFTLWRTTWTVDVYAGDGPQGWRWAGDGEAYVRGVARHGAFDAARAAAAHAGVPSDRIDFVECPALP
jgi:hypothetical protein